DQLERPRRDLLAGAGHADDRRFAPPLVATLEGSTHHFDVANALEAVIDTAVSHGDDHVLDWCVGIIFGIDELGRAELARDLELARVDVDGDDALGFGQNRSLNHREPNAAETEHRDAAAWLDLGGVEHCADTRRYPATQQTHQIERRLFVHFRQRDLGHD